MPPQARLVLEAAQQTEPPYPLAEAYAALGDKDEAFRQLFRRIEDQTGLNYAKADPPFDSLHSDPRWQTVLRGMNLPPEFANEGDHGGAR
jgi:hypothetical protein